MDILWKQLSHEQRQGIQAHLKEKYKIEYHQMNPVQKEKLRIRLIQKHMEKHGGGHHHKPADPKPQPPQHKPQPQPQPPQHKPQPPKSNLNPFDSEVHQIIQHHWNTEGEPKLIKRDYNVVYRAETKDKQKIIIKARKVQKHQKAQMEEQETRQMQYIDCLSKVVNCAKNVGKGVVTTDTMQVIVTQQVAGRELTLHDCKNKESIQAIGTYLRKFHEASREFSAQMPQVAAKFPQWNQGKWAWQGQKCKGLNLPKDNQNYGLIHADFHPGNYMLENKGGHLELNAYDWDNVQHCWFLVDVGAVIHELTQRLWREQMHMDKAKLLKEQQQLVDWLCEAYTGGKYQINREELRKACDFRREFIKHVFGWFIQMKHGGEAGRKMFEGYIHLCNTGMIQYHDICRAR